ncbi:HEAT repeat-containing protein [Cavenderia fasciculata]|uniref:HEAT repeat-containing protein n=1 Tax=Cavenderia fasciculata TaxID=261658 RepID=F4PQC9_CACFS|nr:HEAT repeat-containing protein [Cavenderia fasciculata]EGG22592.1 HEAT repeat-containing protein [Cavenderia fasciculata]|eukprot:XP_004360443.1 HEAT repeat-containing protein [Cavenderia fasciculata]
MTSNNTTTAATMELKSILDRLVKLKIENAPNTNTTPTPQTPPSSSSSLVNNIGNSHNSTTTIVDTTPPKKQQQEENSNSFFSNDNVIISHLNSHSKSSSGSGSGSNNNNNRSSSSSSSSSHTHHNHHNHHHKGKSTLNNNNNNKKYNNINNQHNQNNQNNNNNNQQVVSLNNQQQLEQVNLILNETIQLFNSNSSSSSSSSLSTTTTNNTSTNNTIVDSSVSTVIGNGDQYLSIFIQLSQIIPSQGINMDGWRQEIAKFFQLVTLVCRNLQPSLAQHSESIHHLLVFFISIITITNNVGGTAANASPSSPSGSPGGGLVGSNNFQIRIECLRALSSLLYNNGPNIPTKHQQSLIDLLLPLIPITTNLNAISQPPDINILATVSIGNLCNQCGVKLSKFYPSIFEKLYSNLEKLSLQLTNDKLITKFCCSTLRSIQLITNQSKGIIDSKAIHLLNILKKLMFFGTNINPNAMLPSQLHTVEPIQTRYIPRKKKNHYDSDGLSSSDSDVDERATLSKIRVSSLNLLQAIVKTSPKLFFGYWTQFLPSLSFLTIPSIFTSIIHDPDYRAKQTSIILLGTIFDNTKDHLSTLFISPPTNSSNSKNTTTQKSSSSSSSSSTSSSTSYTSFSQTLVSMIKETHKGLLAVLEAEKNSQLVPLILKSLSILINNTPYNKLDDDMLPLLLIQISSHLRDNNNNNSNNNNNNNNNNMNEMSNNINIPALQCIENILQTEPPTNSKLEISKILDIQQPIITILTNLCNNDLHVKMQARSCLCALTKYYFPSLCQVYSTILNDLFGTLSSQTQDQTSRIQASRILEEISKTMDEYGKSSIKFDNNFEKEYWDYFFKSLTNLIEDSLPQIRASICNCLSHLPSHIFSSLPTRLQLHCVTVILGLSNDDSYVVRASSCRTIGMFVKIESLSDDTTFLSKAASCLYKSMCDTNVNIKIKACWSLANLCDHLVSIRKDEVFNDIPTLILSKVVEVMLLASYDNPKVRSNSVRALGNFARFAPKELLYNTTPVDIQDIIQMMKINQQLHNQNNQQNNQNNQNNNQQSPQKDLQHQQNNIQIVDQYVKNHDKCLLDRIIDSLVINAEEASNSFNFVKVKWNACYALGNIFYNPDIIFDLDTPPQWLHSIYGTLIQLITTCKNYKIKINASAALATQVHSRCQYGKDYRIILDTILQSLTNVNTLIDHTEYQYKDILEKQLGISLIHLIGEMKPNEISSFMDLIVGNHIVLYDTFSRLSIDLIKQKEKDQRGGGGGGGEHQERPSDSRPTNKEFANAIETIKLICDTLTNSSQNLDASNNNNTAAIVNRFKSLYGETNNSHYYQSDDKRVFDSVSILLP